MRARQYFGERRSGIILAADLPTLSENITLIDSIRDLVDVIKVGSPLVYREGMNTVRILADRYSLPVFADLKVADVPHTDAGIVALAREHGASAIMVHGFIGPDALEACVDAGGDDTAVIVQIELTHPGGLLFNQPIADDMVQVAIKAGVHGVQAPGNRPERIRAIRNLVGPNTVIVCCGVGVQGGTYASVLDSGGTYAIVGRSIYEAVDPRSVIADMIQAPVE